MKIEIGEHKPERFKLSTLIENEPVGMTELWIYNKKNKVKYTFNYRVTDKDFNQFKEEIDQFVAIVNKTVI